MRRMFRAELMKLTRRRVVTTTAALAALFALAAPLLVFLAAGAGPGQGPGATLASLAEPGGATEAFAVGASFAGLLVFVVFIANWGAEVSRGTFRTLLMRQPRRGRLLAGKMAALLGFVAVTLLVALVLSAATSALIAPSQGVDTSAWWGFDGLAASIGDYLTTLAAASAWALFGMALALVVGSTPVALGLGVAWAGPIEHLVGQDAWSAGQGWFPGLLLEALAQGGTPQASAARAATLVSVYAAAAVAGASWYFIRRDVAR